MKHPIKSGRTIKLCCATRQKGPAAGSRPERDMLRCAAPYKPVRFAHPARDQRAKGVIQCDRASTLGEDRSTEAGPNADFIYRSEGLWVTP